MNFTFWFLAVAALLFGLSLFYFYKGKYLVGSMLLVVAISTAFGVLIWKRRRQMTKRSSDTQSDTFDLGPSEGPPEQESEYEYDDEHDYEHEYEHEGEHKHEGEYEHDRINSSDFDTNLRDKMNERTTLINAMKERYGL
jgi:ABC-type Zn2+ transport system substrate-binding protein/surface adhesin